MENEIASLLSKYSRYGQLADKKFYTDLYYLLMKYNNLDYRNFNGIKFINAKDLNNDFITNELFGEFVQGLYNNNDRTIYLVLDNIVIDTKKWPNMALNDNAHLTLTNLLRAKILLHEFEHLKQSIECNGIAGQLNKSCPTKIVSSSYALAPNEKFANLYTELRALEITNILELPSKAINYSKHKILITLSNPYLYSSNNDPITEYFKLNECFNPIDNSVIDSLNLTERIVFGFAITNEEYESFFHNNQLDLEQIINILKLDNNNYYLKKALRKS